jgi:hypothetical protein
MNNCANLKLTYVSNNCTYEISDIFYQENPLDNIPAGDSLVMFKNFDFCLMLNQYKIINIQQTMAVLGQDGKPLYLIGEFEEIIQ